MSDVDSRLEDLQELHSKGLLTSEELAQQRAEVLQGTVGTQAVPRIPISGATRLEANPEKSTAPPIVIQPPSAAQTAPAPARSSSPWKVPLALCAGLGLVGVCVYGFSDDIQALLDEPKKKKKVEKKARALPPADICEIEWEMERGEAYEPDRDDYMGSMEMSDCMDRFDSLKAQAEDKDWLSFGDCMDRADSLDDLGDCEFDLSQARRESRKSRKRSSQ
jgi:hypothetical protein